jgi:hypothetical protein
MLKSTTNYKKCFGKEIIQKDENGVNSFGSPICDYELDTICHDLSYRKMRVKNQG